MRSAGGGFDDVVAVGVSAACGVSMSMESSSRAGVAVDGVATLLRPFLFGGIVPVACGKPKYG